jgi:hypothetical protein
MRDGVGVSGLAAGLSLVCRHLRSFAAVWGGDYSFRPRLLKNAATRVIAYVVERAVRGSRLAGSGSRPPRRIRSQSRHSCGVEVNCHTDEKGVLLGGRRQDHLEQGFQREPCSQKPLRPVCGGSELMTTKA